MNEKCDYEKRVPQLLRVSLQNEDTTVAKICWLSIIRHSPPDRLIVTGHFVWNFVEVRFTPSTRPILLVTLVEMYDDDFYHHHHNHHHHHHHYHHHHHRTATLPRRTVAGMSCTPCASTSRVNPAAPPAESGCLRNLWDSRCWYLNHCGKRRS